MRKIPILLLACILFLSSCAARISTTITKKYPTLDYREDVKVIGLKAPAPENSEELGTVKIGDSGLSTNCDWDVVIEKAKLEARKVGGNTIKIISHVPPSVGSSCHSIVAKILKV